MQRVTRDGVGGPLAFENLERDAAFDIWAGGLAGDQAKVVDTVESVFHLPAAMLQTTGQRCYEKGVRLAEEAGWNLGEAISAYHRGLGDRLDRAGTRDRRDKLRSKAAFQFWTQAERNVPLLLAAVASENRPAESESWNQSDWGQLIRQAARDAYELACPHHTSRQMQAFVKGLACLHHTRGNNPTH